MLLPSLFVTYLTRLLSSGQRNSTNQLIYVLFSDVICCLHLCVRVYHSLFLNSTCRHVCYSLFMATALSLLVVVLLLCKDFIHAAFLSAWCFLQQFDDLSGARGRMLFRAHQASPDMTLLAHSAFLEVSPSVSSL